MTSYLVTGCSGSQVSRRATGGARSVSHSDSSAAGDSANQTHSAPSPGQDVGHPNARHYTAPRPPHLPDSLRLHFCSLPQFPSLIKSNPFDFHNRFNYIHLEGSICCRLDKKGEKKVFQECARSGGRQLPVLKQQPVWGGGREQRAKVKYV